MHPRDSAKVNPDNVFFQAASVLGAMWTIGAAFFRFLATLDLQVILHVPQPTVFLAAFWALERARFLVEVIAPSLGNLRIRIIRTARHFVLTGSFTMTVTWPYCHHSYKKIKRAG